MTAPLDRERLAKVLGRLGSEHDGEVVAAARHADALVRRAGLRWNQIIGPPLLAADHARSGIAAEISHCLRNQHCLTEWEARFVASLHDQSFAASPRQLAKLRSIVHKLRQSAEAA
jgi:hypothetical protein